MSTLTKAIEHAEHLLKNCDGRPVPDFVFREYPEQIEAIKKFAGYSETIDAALLLIERTETRRKSRPELPAKRQYISANYAALFVSIGRRDGFGCAHCGEPRPDLQIDHITPIIEGGSNDLSNLQLLCARCNATKSDKV